MKCLCLSFAVNDRAHDGSEGQGCSHMGQALVQFLVQFHAKCRFQTFSSSRGIHACILMHALGCLAWCDAPRADSRSLVQLIANTALRTPNSKSHHFRRTYLAPGCNFQTNAMACIDASWHSVAVRSPLEEYGQSCRLCCVSKMTCKQCHQMPHLSASLAHTLRPQTSFKQSCIFELHA